MLLRYILIMYFGVCASVVFSSGRVVEIERQDYIVNSCSCISCAVSMGDDPDKRVINIANSKSSKQNDLEPLDLSFVNNLPNGVISVVFAFLGHDDLCNLSLASKKYYKLANSILTRRMLLGDQRSYAWYKAQSDKNSLIKDALGEIDIKWIMNTKIQDVVNNNSIWKKYAVNLFRLQLLSHIIPDLKDNFALCEDSINTSNWPTVKKLLKRYKKRQKFYQEPLKKIIYHKQKPGDEIFKECFYRMFPNRLTDSLINQLNQFVLNSSNDNIKFLNTLFAVTQHPQIGLVIVNKMLSSRAISASDAFYIVDLLKVIIKSPIRKIWQHPVESLTDLEEIRLKLENYNPQNALNYKHQPIQSWNRDRLEEKDDLQRIDLNLLSAIDYGQFSVIRQLVWEKLG